MEGDVGGSGVFQCIREIDMITLLCARIIKEYFSVLGASLERNSVWSSPKEACPKHRMTTYIRWH